MLKATILTVTLASLCFACAGQEDAAAPTAAEPVVVEPKAWHAPSLDPTDDLDPEYPTRVTCPLPIERVTLAIDPAFDDASKARILAAWAEWSSVVDAGFQTSTPPSMTLEPEACVVKVLKHDHPDHRYYGWSWGHRDGFKPASFRVWLREDLRGDLLERVVLHELGHLLFLGHRDDPASIMAASMPLDGPRHLDEEDKRIAREIWGGR